jgi:hypothetical protein
MSATNVVLLKEKVSASLPETRERWSAIAVLIFGVVSLYLQLFIVPATPRAAVGDQAIYLHNAARMLEGQLIYRDYDHLTLPGTDLLYAAFFRLFGVRAWIPQAMLLLVGMAMAWLTIFISRKLVSWKNAILAGLLFLALPFSSYLDATHHWFSALAALAAVATIVEIRTPFRLAFAGMFWGLATCFTQSMVLGEVGFAAFVIWECRQRGDAVRSLVKKEGGLLGGFVATVAAINVPIIQRVGFKQFLYFTVVFVLKYYPADRINTWRIYLHEWPRFHIWANWPDLVAWPLMHLLVPFIYVLFFVYYRSSQRLQNPQWERLVLLNVTGVSLFLTIASAPVWHRLFSVSAPSLIVLAWMLDSKPGAERSNGRLMAAAVCLLVIKPVVTQVRWKETLDLPAGRTAFFEPAMSSKFQWLTARTSPGEYLFGDPLAGFALRLKNPSRIAFLRPTDYTRPEEVEGVITGLEQHQVRFVSWNRGLNAPAEAGNHLSPLVQYLHVHYHVARVFANRDEIWERNQSSEL